VAQIGGTLLSMLGAWRIAVQAWAWFRTAEWSEDPLAMFVPPLTSSFKGLDVIVNSVLTWWSAGGAALIAGVALLVYGGNLRELADRERRDFALRQNRIQGDS
jgi:hypothetical protein